MSSSDYERHPDDDVLAEFAAEQLPADQAQNVEAHVIGCTECTQVLADAERVRQLLIRGDPGPMPDPVWERIRGALAAEAVASAGVAGSPPTGSFAQVDGRQPYAGQGVPQPPPSMSFEEAPTAAWRRFLDEPPEPGAAPAAARQVPVRVGRVVRSTVRSRRDARAEDKPARRWLRPSVVVAASAATLAVLAAAGLGVKALVGDGPGAQVSDALPGASALSSVVTSSGVDYTASTLAAQVGVLVARISGSVLGGQPAPTTPGTPSADAPPVSGSSSPTGSSHPASAGASSPGVTSPGASSPGGSAGAGAATTAGTVADPQRLQACLTALGDGTRKPVAVDLAKYEGREAAVIVLPGQSGGYDVWVVARGCSAADQGTLAFKKIPA